MQELDFALERSRRERHVSVRSTEIAVPLWDLVLKDQVIAKSIPSELADLAMILMRVVATVRKDHVWFDAGLESFDPGLELRALIGEIAVFELAEFDISPLRAD